MTNDVIKRFNRDTVWLATGVLGTVAFAAAMLAVQERRPSKVNPTEGAARAGSDLLLNANSSTVGSSDAKSSNSKMTPGQRSSVDHAFNETSEQEIPSSQMELAAWTPTPVLAFTPETNRDDAQANPGSRTLAHRQDSAQAIGPKTRNLRNRSSVAFRFVDVKRRLIELWHQSLARSEKPRSWTAFSNLNRGVRKKSAFTAKTNP
jgi:hypothetical protein